MELRFDLNVFSLAAVKRAAYDSSNISFLISIDGNEIVLTVKRDYACNENFIDDFNKNVLDHQLRIDLENDFGIIRKLIIAQAFSPCDNIEEIIEVIKP